MALSAVRRQAIELLCAAQADGRISDELFQSRLAAVQQAVSDASVEAIVADLMEYDATPGHGVTPYEAELPALPFSEEMRLSAVLSSTRREGNWVVPWQLELLSLFGEMHVDFREAILPDDLISVHVSVTMGSLVLIVPKGTTIQNEVDAILGSSELKRKGKGKSLAAPNGLTLRVTGNILLGSVEIREV